MYQCSRSSSLSFINVPVHPLCHVSMFPLILSVMYQCSRSSSLSCINVPAHPLCHGSMFPLILSVMYQCSRSSSLSCVNVPAHPLCQVSMFPLILSVMYQCSYSFYQSHVIIFTLIRTFTDEDSFSSSQPKINVTTFLLSSQSQSYTNIPTYLV
jgi:hypothetical protein